MEWIDIKKQKPSHCQQVLITDGDLVTAAKVNTKFYSDGNIWWDGCNISGQEWDWDFDEQFITHWMPLPVAPNQSLGHDGK